MKPGAPRAPKATESNARTERELLYPFGHQNDLGHVVLTRPQVKRWHNNTFSLQMFLQFQSFFFFLIRPLFTCR